MAQNEGRTLRRAPKTSYSHLGLFVAMLLAALAFGMVVHVLKAAALSALTTETNYQHSAQANLGINAGTEPSSHRGGVPSEVTDLGDVPDCTPARYQLPTPLNISGLPSGMTTVEDSLQQYTIYGNTAEQRSQQLQRCAPGGEYAGAASYQITWQYAYAVRSDGLCQIVQPKIGLHLTMILPRWQAGNQASSQEQTAWNAYIAALTTHERGHYSISKQYAQIMLHDLQDLSAQQCGNIQLSADTLLESRLAQLKTAQENYDATTNHGATQGAVL
jgi:predicted secreted Zn-dependent protease